MPNGYSNVINTGANLKTILYIRVSTDKQQNGLEAQRRALEQFCASRGITEFEVYEDFAISGTSKSRPQLDLMMQEVRSGTVNTVIVYSFSRFARSTKFLLDTLEEFGGLGVNFVSLTENIDLSTPIGKAMFSIIAALATLERDLVSQRVKMGMLNAKAKGKQIGRPQSLPDDLIASMRARGLSYREISKMLKIGQGSITSALRRVAQKQKSSDH